MPSSAHWLSPSLFSRAEKYWIAGYGLALIVLTTLPYLIFTLLTPIHQHYTWASVFYFDDYFQYYAWARHISDGDWLIRNYYTDNPQGSFALFNPFFLLLGWTTRLVGNVYLAYHLLRVIAVGCFAYISYAFISLFLTEPRLRRLAQLLLLAGGMEYPYFLIAQTRFPTPLADPYIYKILYRYGHLTAALCLMLLGLGSYLALIRRFQHGKLQTLAELRAITPLVLSFMISIGLLGLINPYYIFLVGGILIIHAVRHILFFFDKEIAQFILFLIIFSCGLPLLNYAMQPVVNTFENISFDEPISTLDLILFFALYIPFAWVGKGERKFLSEEGKSHFFLLFGWIVVVVLAAMSSIDFRARATFAAGFPLAILAAAGVGKAGKITSQRHWPIYALMLVDMAFVSYKEAIDFKAEKSACIDLAMKSALDELNTHARNGEVVLTPSQIGVFVPAYTKANTYVGHSFQTDSFYVKDKRVNAFFRGEYDKIFANSLGIKDISYILIPPRGRVPSETLEQFRWTKVYDKSGYIILVNGK